MSDLTALTAEQQKALEALQQVADAFAPDSVLLVYRVSLVFADAVGRMEYERMGYADEVADDLESVAEVLDEWFDLGWYGLGVSAQVTPEQMTTREYLAAVEASDLRFQAREASADEESADEESDDEESDDEESDDEESDDAGK